MRKALVLAVLIALIPFHSHARGPYGYHNGGRAWVSGAVVIGIPLAYYGYRYYYTPPNYHPPAYPMGYYGTPPADYRAPPVNPIPQQHGQCATWLWATDEYGRYLVDQYNRPILVPACQ